MIMFALSAKSIDGRDFRRTAKDRESGAWVVFEGRVRAKSRGRKVRWLEYEASPKLAAAEFGRIVREIRRKFEVVDVFCVHRVGRVRVGRTAVRVAVTAAHRDAAFAACRYAIDQLKKRLPIWKKEYFSDGTAAWVRHGK